VRDPSYKPPGSKILTIPISPELHQRLRVAVAQQGTTMKEFGIESLKAALMEHEKGHQES